MLFFPLKKGPDSGMKENHASTWAVGGSDSTGRKAVKLAEMTATPYGEPTYWPPALVIQHLVWR